MQMIFKPSSTAANLRAKAIVDGVRASHNARLDHLAPQPPSRQQRRASARRANKMPIGPSHKVSRRP